MTEVSVFSSADLQNTMASARSICTPAPHSTEQSLGPPESRPLGRKPATSPWKKEIKIKRPSSDTLQTVAYEASTSPRIKAQGDSGSFTQELSSILVSPSAIANPSAALVRALAHHREHLPLSSIHSFNIMLSYAARISNYHAMRKILREMQKGNVQWDEETRKIVMKATLRGSGGGSGITEPSSETSSTEVKLSSASRRFGMPKDGNDGLSALKRRLDASPSSITDEHRQIALNAGYWQSEKPPRSNAQCAAEPSGSPSLPSDAGKAPATRLSVLQDALSPAMARSHLPPLDVQLSPTLFLAFLRYILACNPQPPSLAESYAALIALDRSERKITSKHLTHLVHLYLHPSLYASFRPFWVIREMQRLSKDGSVIFTPTSETLEKALLSLRLRRNRARLAIDLVDYFRRKWGEEIISIACWRLLGRYGLEGNNTTAQELATSGGKEALARQIEHDAKHTKDVSSGVIEAMAANTISGKVDLFPGHGLDRRKWGRVRQSIVRSQRRARRAEARIQAEAADSPYEKDSP